MEFAWKPEHVAYRERLRGVLRSHLPADWDAKSRHDPGSPYVVEFARGFCPLLAREGLLIPHWPVEDGGQGADPWHHWILGEEMFAAGEPRSYQYMNVNWIGPAILKYGTREQRDLHIPRITGGAVFWCQGFSEPSAGSDLAAMKTRAEPIPGGYRINGQKIWTSAANFADYCFLLARTGKDRHAITVFLVPMDTPGIEVRPINSLTGKGSLNEVFFTDVEVPESIILGEVDKGWGVVRSVLHNERIGAPRYMMAHAALDRAAAVLQRLGQFDDPEIKGRMGLARAAVDAAALQAYRVIDGRAKGREPGPETNVARYALVRADRAVGEFFADCLGDLLLTAEEQTIVTQYRRAASTGLGAGAAEIQLNLVARTFLELPKAS